MTEWLAAIDLTTILKVVVGIVAVALVGQPAVTWAWGKIKPLIPSGGGDSVESGDVVARLHTISLKLGKLDETAINAVTDPDVGIGPKLDRIIELLDKGSK